MTTPRLMPQIEFLGKTAITGKTVTPQGDRCIERIVGVPAGTAAALRSAMVSYPDGTNYKPDYIGYWENVATWNANANKAVCTLWEWTGWRIDEMATHFYIEKLSGRSAYEAGHTEDDNDVAILIDRNRIDLSEGISPSELQGLAWG
jgi:hypothetical protein